MNWSVKSINQHHGQYTHVSCARSIAGVMAVDVADEVGEGEVLQDDTRVVRTFGVASGVLVDVLLVDEDGECDVVDVNVGPGDVAHKALASDPGLETGCIKAAGDSDAIEVDVRNLLVRVLVLAEGSNGKAFGRQSAISFMLNRL